MESIQSIINLISYIFFIMLSFWCINTIPFHKFMGKFEIQARFLIVFLSIALGYNVANFFISLINNIHNLTFMIK